MSTEVRWLQTPTAPEPTGVGGSGPAGTPRTAYVLGGGGNLGAVQVGMLRALLERGIAPDVVVGCSVGAINGAAIAADPTLNGLHRLAGIWREVDGSDLCPSTGLASLWNLARRGLGIHGDEGLRALVQGALPFERFEDAAVPLHVVATSLETGRERWFTAGPAADPILASAALPGAFPPVEIDGELFVDGAVVDNVPIARAVQLGAERVVVMHVGNFQRPRPQPKRPIDVLLQAFSISRNYRYFHDITNVPDHVELIELPGIDPGNLKYSDFRRSIELMERGYHAAVGFLEREGRVAASF